MFLYSLCIYIGRDTEDFELVHQGFGVGSGGLVHNESDYLFLSSHQWLYVVCLLFVCSPDRDSSDEMRVYMCICWRI